MELKNKFFCRRNLFALPLLFSLTARVLGIETTNAQFLNIGVGSREMAMGNSGAALAQDLYSSNSNPAGLGSLPQKQLGFVHTQWLLDTSFDFVGFAFPVNNGGLEVSGEVFSTGEQEGRDENRQKTSNFSNHDSVLHMGYGSMVTGNMSLGLGIKYFESRLGRESSRGIGFDLGSKLKGPGGFLYGATMRNLGPDIKYVDQSEHLPTSFSLGLAKGISQVILLSSEYERVLYSDNNQFKFGVEFRPISYLTIRGGLLTEKSNTPNSRYLDSISHIVGGIGLNMKNIDLDYAFSPDQNLGTIQRFSVLMRFDSPTNPINNSNQILFDQNLQNK